MSIAVGDALPPFAVFDQEGRERAFADLVGERGLVIYFYPKDNTSGCTTEARAFQSHLAAFAAKGCTVVGVSKDSVATHVDFCGKQGLTFPLLSDADGRLCEAFGVWREKRNFGKTYMGIVRTTFVVNGAGRVTKIYPNVRVKAHAEKVLMELDGLLA